MDTGINPAGVTLDEAPLYATPLEKPAEERKFPFNGARYLQRRCSLLGVDPIPELVMQYAKEQTKEYGEFSEVGNARRRINVRLAEYREGLPKPQISSTHVEDLVGLVNPSWAPEARDLQLRLQNANSEARRAWVRHQDAVRAALEAKQKLAVLMARGTNTSVIPQVQQILDGGWYKLLNVRKSDEDSFVSFVTPPVYCRFLKPEAGIDMDVLMGSYQVCWFPNLGKITVMAHDDNLNIDGCIHPHVDGSICWGNAVNLFRTSMENLDPAPAFEALKTILQTYNDDSPYEQLTDFALLRDPDLFKGAATTFIKRSERIWLSLSELSHSADDIWHIDEHTEDDDDDEGCILVTPYRKVYAGTNTRANLPDNGPDVIYLKVGTNGQDFERVSLNDRYFDWE